MGNLARIGLAKLVARHGLDTMVETGTGHGHSLIAALQVPELTELHSVEVDPETHYRAAATFAAELRVRLYLGSSVEVLPKIIPELRHRRVLWFLDAHYPGSGRIVPLPQETHGKPAQAVPVEAEVMLICAHRGAAFAQDVLVIDDLCLFEAGGYEHDHAAELRSALGLSLAPVYRLLEATHVVSHVMLDGGYVLARPRRESV